MKQYVIDELRPTDCEKLKEYLDGRYSASVVEGIYWIPLAEDILTDVQASHSACQPFYFAADLQPGQLAVELLVRTQSRIRCDCIAYATEAQRNWLIRMTDAILESLDITC